MPFMSVCWSSAADSCVSCDRAGMSESHVLCGEAVLGMIQRVLDTRCENKSTMCMCVRVSHSPSDFFKHSDVSGLRRSVLHLMPDIL